MPSLSSRAVSSGSQKSRLEASFGGPLRPTIPGSIARSVTAGDAPSSQSRTVGVDGIIGFHLNSRPLSISSMQLDIFADSRDVMLRNDVLSALQRYDARETQQTLRRLSDEYPDDDSIPQLTVLAAALDLRSTTSFSKHEVAAEARCALFKRPPRPPCACGASMRAPDGFCPYGGNWRSARLRCPSEPIRSTPMQRRYG